MEQTNWASKHKCDYECDCIRLHHTPSMGEDCECPAHEEEIAEAMGRNTVEYFEWKTKWFNSNK